MSETTTAAVQPARGSFFAWLRRMSRAAWRKIQGAYRATKGFFARVARRTWEGTKAVAKPVGTWTMKGLGWAGSVITGIPMYAAKTVIIVVSGGVGLMALGATTLTNMWRDHVYDRFGWLRYRADHKISFREYRLMRQIDRDQARERAFQAIDKFADSLDPASVERRPIQLDDEVIIYDTTEDLRTEEVLREKVALRTQADLDNESESFPGAKVTQVAVENPYEAEGTSYEPELGVLQHMERWLAAHPETPAVEFVFERPWPVKEQIDAVSYLKNEAHTSAEASYWEGRFQALVRYANGTLDLESHGRAWAMVHQHYKNARKLQLPQIRTGFVDMVEDLKKQRDFLERAQRSQAVATSRP